MIFTFVNTGPLSNSRLIESKTSGDKELDRSYNRFWFWMKSDCIVYAQYTLLSWNFTLHTLIHTFPFEILLPHIVVIPTEFDIKTSRIFVVSNVATISRAQPEESLRSAKQSRSAGNRMLYWRFHQRPFGLLAKSGDLTKLKWCKISQLSGCSLRLCRFP